MTNDEIKEAIAFVASNGNFQAQAYARRALVMFVQTEVYDSYDIATQILYILGNFKDCRAQGHKECRQALKKAVLELSA